MRPISIKLVAPVFGTLALVLATACEERTETAPSPEQLNTPGEVTAPGTTGQNTNALQPARSGSPGMGGASSLSADETQPVSGKDMQPLGGGGHAGHAGHGGHDGHGGKKGH
jgi:hypothetical protein